MPTQEMILTEITKYMSLQVKIQPNTNLAEQIDKGNMVNATSTEKTTLLETESQDGGTAEVCGAPTLAYPNEANIQRNINDSEHHGGIEIGSEKTVRVELAMQGVPYANFNEPGGGGFDVKDSEFWSQSQGRNDIFNQLLASPRIPARAKQGKEPIIDYANSYVVASIQYTKKLTKKALLKDATEKKAVRRKKERVTNAASKVTNYAKTTTKKATERLQMKRLRQAHTPYWSVRAKTVR